MKKLIVIFIAINLALVSCKQKKTDDINTTIEQNMDEIKSSTAEQGKAGNGKISLICNGKTYEINGVCGAVTSMGSLTIAVPDDSFPAKVFTINFANNELPSTTSSYNIVQSVYDDKDATHVSLSYADMRSTSTMIWESDSKTGKLDFIANGNEIKCNFENLALQPSLMYNKGELNAPATISGELTIYKN